jgi:hypothetical protein
MSIWYIDDNDSESFNSDDEIFNQTLEISENYNDTESNDEYSFENYNLSEEFSEEDNITPFEFDINYKNINYKEIISSGVEEILLNEYELNNIQLEFNEWLKLPTIKKKYKELFNAKLVEYKSNCRIVNNIKKNIQNKYELEKKKYNRQKQIYKKVICKLYDEIDNYDIYQIIKDDYFFGLIIMNKSVKCIPDNLNEYLTYYNKPESIDEFIIEYDKNDINKIKDYCPEIYFHDILNNGIINVKRNITETFDIDFGLRFFTNNRMAIEIPRNHIFIIESYKDFENIDISNIDKLL